MKSKFFKLILKLSKTVIAELSEKQIDDLFDINYLKENAPERVYDGQFTDISGKVWNYSDIEKMVYIPDSKNNMHDLYCALSSMGLVQYRIEPREFLLNFVSNNASANDDLSQIKKPVLENEDAKYFAINLLSYRNDIVKPLFTTGDMIEACKTK